MELIRLPTGHEHPGVPGPFHKTHVMAYMTPNQTAKTITKFLYQGYI